MWDRVVCVCVEHTYKRPPRNIDMYFNEIVNVIYLVCVFALYDTHNEYQKGLLLMYVVYIVAIVGIGRHNFKTFSIKATEETKN